MICFLQASQAGGERLGGAWSFLQSLTVRHLHTMSLPATELATNIQGNVLHVIVSVLGLSTHVNSLNDLFFFDRFVPNDDNNNDDNFRSSTPDPNMLLDLNNNTSAANKEIVEMRERTGRRDVREISERDIFERAEPRVRRKVSRVESLKRILFNRSSDSDDKKRRSKSAEAEIKRSTVDKGVGPDSGHASEDDVITPRASCLDLTSEIGEFDSVSQISCMENHDRWHFIRRNGSMSVSSDMLSAAADDHSTVVSSASKRNQFPYAYLKSKLSTLPEELNNSRSKCKESQEYQTSVVGTQSEVGSKHSSLAPSQRLKMLAIRRKKSQSLADLHQNSPIIIEKSTSSKCEESGYDSDTRKSAETVSPKSSDKSDESDSAETSGSFTSDIKDSDTDAEEPHYQIPRRMTESAGSCRPITPQKPPRRSKLHDFTDEQTLATVTRSHSQPVGAPRERSTSAQKPIAPSLSQKNFKVNKMGQNICHYLSLPLLLKIHSLIKVKKCPNNIQAFRICSFNLHFELFISLSKMQWSHVICERNFPLIYVEKDNSIHCSFQRFPTYAFVVELLQSQLDTDSRIL